MATLIFQERQTMLPDKESKNHNQILIANTGDFSEIDKTHNQEIINFVSLKPAVVAWFSLKMEWIMLFSIYLIIPFL